MSLFDVIKPRIVEVGKLKAGGKNPTERKSAGGGTWRAPEKYDHWIVTTLHRDGKGDLIKDSILMDQLVAEGHADPDGKLRRIPISVMSNELDEIMQSSYLAYAGRRLAARSDGVTLVKFANKGKWLNYLERWPMRPW